MTNEAKISRKVSARTEGERERYFDHFYNQTNARENPRSTRNKPSQHLRSIIIVSVNPSPRIGGARWLKLWLNCRLRTDKSLKCYFLEEADTDAVCRSFDIEKDYLRVLVHRAKSRFRNVLTTNVEAQRAPHPILLSGSARKKALNRFHELADLQLQGLASKANLNELAEIDRMLSAETAPLEYTRALETLAYDRKLLRESMTRIERLLSRSSLNKTA